MGDTNEDAKEAGTSYGEKSTAPLRQRRAPAGIGCGAVAICILVMFVGLYAVLLGRGDEAAYRRAMADQDRSTSREAVERRVNSAMQYIDGYRPYRPGAVALGIIIMLGGPGYLAYKWLARPMLCEGKWDGQACTRPARRNSRLCVLHEQEARRRQGEEDDGREGT